MCPCAGVAPTHRRPHIGTPNSVMQLPSRTSGTSPTDLLSHPSLRRCPSCSTTWSNAWPRMPQRIAPMAAVHVLISRALNVATSRRRRSRSAAVQRAETPTYSRKKVRAPTMQQTLCAESPQESFAKLSRRCLCHCTMPESQRMDHALLLALVGRSSLCAACTRNQNTPWSPQHVEVAPGSAQTTSSA